MKGRLSRWGPLVLPDPTGNVNGGHGQEGSSFAIVPVVALLKMINVESSYS